MKTFRKSYVPDSIEHNGKTFVMDAYASANNEKPTGDCVKLIVTNSRLRGKTDLHGNPYPSSTYYFIPAEEKQKQRIKFWVGCFMPRTQKWCSAKLHALNNGTDPTLRIESVDESNAKIAALKQVLGR